MIESLTGTHADWIVGIARIVLGIIFFPPQHFLSAVAKEYDPQYDASYPHDPVSVSTCQTLDHQSFSIVAGVSPNLSKPSSTHARALSQSAYSKLPFFATLGAELARVPGLPRPIEPLFRS